MKKATMAATAILAAGVVAAGGLWTHEVSVGTNGVTLAAAPATEWRLADAVSPSNTAVAVEYVTATTNAYPIGAVTNGALVLRGALVPPVSGDAKLVLKAAAGSVPVLATIEGAGLTTD